MNTLTITEAADFLKIHPQTLRQLAISGTVAGAKIGRAWVFLQDDLVCFLRSRYARPGLAQQQDREKKCSINGKITASGGPGSKPGLRWFSPYKSTGYDFDLSIISRTIATQSHDPASVRTKSGTHNEDHTRNQ